MLYLRLYKNKNRSDYEKKVPKNEDAVDYKRVKGAGNEKVNLKIADDDDGRRNIREAK